MGETVPVPPPPPPPGRGTPPVGERLPGPVAQGLALRVGEALTVVVSVPERLAERLALEVGVVQAGGEEEGLAEAVPLVVRPSVPDTLGVK